MPATPATTLFRARVPARRLRKAEKVLHKLGLDTADAFNMLLAEIELRQGLPFEVSSRPVLNSEEQAAEWTHAFGAY